MKIQYKAMNLKPKTLEIIEHVDAMMSDYEAQGIVMNLRMVYYQLVSQNLIENKISEYDRLGTIIANGRMCGLLDWDMLEDQTRNIKKSSYWLNPASIINTCAKSYQTDLWQYQKYRPEVWVEKDALGPVIGPTCQQRQVPYMVCRGYMSQSEMWDSHKRIQEYLNDGKKVLILHMGDHDPSGLDMTRDINDRLLEFLAYNYCVDHWDCDPYDAGNLDAARGELSEWFEVRRIALTVDQIEEYNPLPQPVKQQDGRWKQYVKETGLNQSWELDALKPTVLRELIDLEIDQILNVSLWNKAIDDQNVDRSLLKKAADHWDKVTKYVEEIE